MKVTFALFCLFIIQINAAPNIARPVVPIASTDVRSGNDAVVVSENSKPRTQPQPAPKLHVEQTLATDPKQNQVDSEQKPVDSQQNVIQKQSEPEQTNVVQQKEVQLPIAALNDAEPKPAVPQNIIPLIIPNIQNVEPVIQPMVQPIADGPVQIQEQIVPIVPEVAPIIIAPIPPIAQFSPIVPIPIVPEPKSVSLDTPEQNIQLVPNGEQIKVVEQVQIDQIKPIADLRQVPEVSVPEVKVPEIVVQEKKEEKVIESVERKEEPKVVEPVVADVKKDIPSAEPTLNSGELHKEVPKVEEQKPVVVVEVKQQEQPIIVKEEPKPVESELKKPLESKQSQTGIDLPKQQPL